MQNIILWNAKEFLGSYVYPVQSPEILIFLVIYTVYWVNWSMVPSFCGLFGLWLVWA